MSRDRHPQNQTPLTMAKNTAPFPDLISDKFLGNDLDQVAKLFQLTVENKINFSLGWKPTDASKRLQNLFGKKALFSSRLQGPAAEWYADSKNDAATWDQIRTTLIDRFSDDRDKYRQRITAENCVRRNEELIKNFYHRFRISVDKGGPLDPNRTQAERYNQQNQRNAKHIEFTVRGLKPSGLKREAREYLIQQPNATWDALQTHITSKDVIYTISSEQVPNATSDQNTKLHSLEQQIKEPTALFTEQKVNQVTRSNSRPANGDNKSRQKTTRFCTYCRNNGHTPLYSRTKAYDDEIKRKQTRNNQERRTNFTHYYIKKRGPNFGSQNTQNSDQQTEMKTTRHPIDKLASTQIGIDIGPEIDNSTKTHQATLGTADQITVSRLSITTVLDQRIPILSKARLSTEQQSTYSQLSSIHQRLKTGCESYPFRLPPFKLLKSPRPDEESNFKSRFQMKAFYFHTGDNQKDSGLEIDFMLDTGAAWLIINYRTCLENAQFRQPITVVRSKQKTKTYTADIVRMIGHTTISFSFDSDENTSSNCDYGLQSHSPRIYLGLNFADNTFRICTSKYQQ